MGREGLERGLPHEVASAAEAKPGAPWDPFVCVTTAGFLNECHARLTRCGPNTTRRRSARRPRRRSARGGPPRNRKAVRADGRRQGSADRAPAPAAPAIAAAHFRVPWVPVAFAIAGVPFATSAASADPAAASTYRQGREPLRLASSTTIRLRPRLRTPRANRSGTGSGQIRDGDERERDARPRRSACALHASANACTSHPTRATAFQYPNGKLIRSIWSTAST